MRVNPNSLLAVLVGLTLLSSINASAAVVTDGSGNARFRDDGQPGHIDIGGSLQDSTFEYHGVSGDAVASLTKTPLPLLSASLVSAPATPFSYPNIGTYSNLALDVSFQYYFRIDGPSAYTVVPVLISGNFEVSTVGNSYSTAVANTSLYTVGGATNYQSPVGYCIGLCDDTNNFTGLINAYSGQEVKIVQTIELRAISSIQGGISSASAYIDPYIYIDPTWALTHPGYSVTVSNGFGNTAPVPEAETYAMMLAGLGLVGFMARRRKQAKA